MHSQIRQKGIAGAVACRSGPGIRFGFDSDLRLSKIRIERGVVVGLRSTHDLTVHVPSVSIVTVVETAERAGPRELALILGHVVHAVRDWNHAKGVDHVVTGKVAQTIEVVEITVMSKTSCLLCLLVLLNMGLRMRQVAGSGGVATADRTLLEMTLEDITSREGIAAENTHVWAITGV
ncbi:hypothetical protein HG531_006295 [Fusarium graminearum]|nr:hypothetical protein HG531_006295 [Fusarium graminearum]